MQNDAADKLDVEVAEADRAPARLAAQGKRLDQQVVQVLAFLGPLAELVRAAPQARIVQRLDLVLQVVDGLCDRHVALDFALVRIEKAGKDGHGS